MDNRKLVTLMSKIFPLNGVQIYTCILFFRYRSQASPSPSQHQPVTTPPLCFSLITELDLLDACMFQTILKGICMKLLKGLEK